MVKSEKIEVVRGSGNVFRDLGHRSADVLQFKSILAAEIIKALDREGLRCVELKPTPELQQPISLVSATPTWDGSPWIGLCPSSTGSDHEWK